MIIEDESAALQIVPTNIHNIHLKNNIFLQLSVIDNSIWGFVYFSRDERYLVVINECLTGENIRRVFKKAVKLIKSEITFIDYRLVVITKDNL